MRDEDMAKSHIVFLVIAASVMTALAENAHSFADGEAVQIFKMFDTDGDGKVDRTEFDFNRVAVIYRNLKTDPINGAAFEQTRLSREFFDSLDRDHNGLLRPIEIYDGFKFERIAGERGQSFDIDDLRRFLSAVGR